MGLNRHIAQVLLVIHLAIFSSFLSEVTADDAIHVASSGKVGIQNNSPSEALDVNGKIEVTNGGLTAQLNGSEITFDRSGGDSYIHATSTTGGLRFQVNSSDYLILRNSETFLDQTLRFGKSTLQNCSYLYTSGGYLSCATSWPNPYPSSIRFKENIKDYTSGLSKLNKLNPVSFNWKDRAQRGAETRLGLIAEEVEEVAPEFVIKGDQGVVEGVQYADMTAILINSIKELSNRIETLEARCNNN